MTLTLTISAVALLATVAFGLAAVVRENRRDNERSRDTIIDRVKTEIRACLAEHVASCPRRVTTEQSGRLQLP